MAGTGTGILNLIYGNNPEQALGDYSKEQLARARAAGGMDSEGNVLPAPAPGSAPGVGSGQITAPDGNATVQASGALPPGKESNSSKTPTSWGSLLMDLQQRDEASAGLNQALGLGFSAFSRPENRDRVSRAFNVEQPDVSKIGTMLLNAQNNQDATDRGNSLGQQIMNPNTGPQLANRLNMTWDSLKARYAADPGGVGTMIQSYFTPTDDLKNLQGLQRMGAGGAGASPTLNDAAAGIVGKIGGQPAMDMAQAAWRQKNPGKPDSEMPWKVNDPGSYAQYAANRDELNKSVATAAETHGHNIGMVTDMSHRIDDVQNDPALKTLLNEPGAKKTWAKSLINDSTLTPINVLAQSLPSGISFSPDELRVIDNLRQLKGGQYANALHALGLSRPSEREIEGINSGLGQITNLDLDYDTYKEQGLGQMGDTVKSMIGNSFGASQNLKDMPPELRTFVDPQYLAGGSRALEDNGSEKWADSVKMQPDEIKEAQSLLTSGKINPKTNRPWTRRDVDQLVRSEGKRPFGY